MNKFNIKMDKEYLELIEMCDDLEFDVERAKYLLSLVDVNAFCGEYGYTLLSNACNSNNFEMVKLLVEAGADVNQTECYNDTLEYFPVIWDLQFCKLNNFAEEESKTLEDALIRIDENNNPRIKILRYLLTHGAITNFMSETETLIFYVATSYFFDFQFEYDQRVHEGCFLKNVIALSWDMPEFFTNIKNVEINKLSSYKCIWCEDGERKTIVKLIDEKEEDVRIFHYSKYVKSQHRNY